MIHTKTWTHVELHNQRHKGFHPARPSNHLHMTSTTSSTPRQGYKNSLLLKTILCFSTISPCEYFFLDIWGCELFLCRISARPRPSLIRKASSTFLFSLCLCACNTPGLAIRPSKIKGQAHATFTQPLYAALSNAQFPTKRCHHHWPTVMRTQPPQGTLKQRDKVKIKLIRQETPNSVWVDTYEKRSRKVLVAKPR